MKFAEKMENTQPVRIDPVSNSKNLYIIFGGIAAGIGMPPFEFAKASNILSETRVFIRDLRQNWYQSGLPGISSDINGTKLYLENLIKEHSPEEVIMVGNSMGGFAAIMFSSLIGNSRAVAFAPQTFISPLKRLQYRDLRWQREITLTYIRSCMKQGIWDLKKLGTQDNWSAEILVSKRNRLDHLHAFNLADLSGVKIREYDIGGHGLVKRLRDSGELSCILRQTSASCERIKDRI